jgi:acyl-CoA reductase-like NAD-dependent aldehyde dehydrogenase
VPSLFIDGEWVASGDGACSQIVNPSDGSVVTEVDVATDDQVQAAIGAARRAFDTTDWPRTPTGERAALLDRVADLMERDLEKVAEAETLNTGKALRESRATFATWSACSVTTRTSPIRTLAAWSMPVRRTCSAASSTNRSGSAV